MKKPAEEPAGYNLSGYTTGRNFPPQPSRVHLRTC